MNADAERIIKSWETRKILGTSPQEILNNEVKNNSTIVSKTTT